MKYFIEHRPSQKWLTVGGNTTNDPLHPGIISFDTKEEADFFIGKFDNNWEVTEHEFVNNQ